MKFINWIKSLFAPKPIEPINQEWIMMVNRVNKQKETIAKATQMREVVRSSVPKAPPAPPTRFVRDDVKPKAAPRSESVHTADTWMAAPYYGSTYVDDTPSRCTSSYSSSSSDDDTRHSCSGSSYSGGGGSFDGGGSSSDW